MECAYISSGVCRGLREGNHKSTEAPTPQPSASTAVMLHWPSGVSKGVEWLDQKSSGVGLYETGSALDGRAESGGPRLGMLRNRFNGARKMPHKRLSGNLRSSVLLDSDSARIVLK